MEKYILIPRNKENTKGTIEWEIAEKVLVSLMLVDRLGYVFAVRIHTQKKHWWNKSWISEMFHSHDIKEVIASGMNFLEKFGFHIDPMSVDLFENWNTESATKPIDFQELLKTFQDMAILAGSIRCDKCGEIAEFYGLKQSCLKCNTSLSGADQYKQLLLAWNYLSLFIEMCDELHEEKKEAILGLIKQQIDSLEYSHSLLVYEPDVLINIIAHLEAIGGKSCGGVIRFSNNEKFHLELVKNQIPKFFPEVATATILSLKFIFNFK